MKYKARAMNAYLYASNLAHIPRQIAWNAAKRGVAAIKVKSAYSSQECSLCHYVDRANRPNQQTFCCRVCGSPHARRSQRGHQYQAPPSRRGIARLQEQESGQSLADAAPSGMEKAKRLAVVQPPAQSAVS